MVRLHARVIAPVMLSTYYPAMTKPNRLMQAFGRRLRQARIVLGWQTGREFARALDELETTVSMWERGERIPRPVAMQKIRAKTGLSMDWLLFGDDRGLTVELSRALNVKADDQKKP